MTAHSEVLLRSVEDVAMFTNLTALAAYRCGAEIMTDSEMSTHLHETVRCANPEELSNRQLRSLTKAFNYRHSRKGPLFDDQPFILKIEGPRHMQMALNYSLRQGLHHGQSETAFDYPWSTCNFLFASQRGAAVPKAIYKTRGELRSLLPKNENGFPDCWQGDANGILLRNTFEELALVENWYGTARSYIYSMIRKTSEEWLAEQNKDNTDEPVVTLNLIENNFSSEEVSEMLTLEGNSKYVSRGRSDMELCEMIDSRMIGRYGASSVYQLRKNQKETLAKELWYDLGIRNAKQIRRCLVMDYDR